MEFKRFSHMNSEISQSFDLKKKFQLIEIQRSAPLFCKTPPPVFFSLLSCPFLFKSIFTFNTPPIKITPLLALFCHFLFDHIFFLFCDKNYFERIIIPLKFSGWKTVEVFHYNSWYKIVHKNSQQNIQNQQCPIHLKIMNSMRS